MKRVVVLGSTGSIGTQTLDVVERFPDRLEIVGLASGSNAELLRKQAARFGVHRLALANGTEPDIPSGMDAIVQLATMPEADVVVVSVAGVIGLVPTLAAIETGKQIALASKEVLVAAGEIVMPLVQKHGTVLTPIDSEHSAVFQCLQGYSPEQVERLILTASGGPFRGWDRDRLAQVTVQQALNHPTWSMGGKITIDSATLMNKALEVIEAKWLFDLAIDRVEVVCHPQSVVHSMVEFRDGSVLGQMGWPDMRLPIAYALLYPDRIANGLTPWDPTKTPSLTFEPIDRVAFPALELARSASAMGGTAPCAFNAANEEAANAFLHGEIPFLAIYDVVRETLLRHEPVAATLESILDADRMARETSRNLMAVVNTG